MGSDERRKSKLVPLGFALMIVGIAFPRALQGLASNLEPGTLSRMVDLVGRGLVLCFLIGLGAAIAGLVRNRRMMKG